MNTMNNEETIGGTGLGDVVTAPVPTSEGQLKAETAGAEMENSMDDKVHMICIAEIHVLNPRVTLMLGSPASAR